MKWKKGLSEKRSIIDTDETILWRGSPDKKAFILPALIAIPFVLIFAGFFYLILRVEMPTFEYAEIVIIRKVILRFKQIVTEKRYFQ